MLDSFERRLTDLLADALSSPPNSLVVRAQENLDDLLEVQTDRVLVVVRLLSAEANQILGDDGRERLGQRGAYQLRPVLYLKGEVALDFMIAPPAPAGDPLQPRQRLFQVLDQTLLALHQDNVRQGRAFLLTDEDLGFELDGFRLTQVGPLPDRPDNVRSLRTIYQYAGRFWPVEIPAEGGIIQHLPTRLVILPVQIPEGLTAQAGGADVTIPLPVDLRAFNGAPVRLVARLRGASPPGTLRGDSADVPAGFVAYAPDDAGVFQVVYRPPATLSNDTQVRVSLGLAHADRPTVQLGELKLQVRR